MWSGGKAAAADAQRQADAAAAVTPTPRDADEAALYALLGDDDDDALPGARPPAHAAPAGAARSIQF
jgi:hypothetical protein